MAPSEMPADAGFFRRWISWPVQGLGFFIMLTAFAIMPRSVALAVSAKLAQTAGPRLHKHNKTLWRNLTAVFPDLSPVQVAALSREIWGNFGRVLADYAHYHRYLAPDQQGTVEVVGFEHLNEAAKEGAWLLVGAHFGNWELAGALASRHGNKLTALYTPRENPWIDRQIQKRRGRASGGASLLPKWAMRQVVEALRRGEAVFLLADQRVGGGEWVPFFGRPAETTAAPARMARRFNCPIVTGRAEQLAEGRYRVTYFPPLRPDPSRDAEADILAMTAALNAQFESWIRERPDQWTCLKRRWRNAHKSRTAEAATPIRRAKAASVKGA
jgi:KDO2-lipid IV(A) lauroyltransferase